MPASFPHIPFVIRFSPSGLQNRLLRADNQPMARIILVTGRGFRHQWLLDRACRRFGGQVVGWLVQADRPPGPPVDGRWSRMRRSLKRMLARSGVNLPVYLNLTPAERCLWLKHGEPELDWRRLGIESVRADRDPNSPESLAWLTERRPDLVVVFGGKLLAEPWFQMPPMGAINFHYGITPDYRGAESVTWAAYHENWSRIGATIHRIDAGVDTGTVISQQPVAVQPGDHLDSLTARVYWTGMGQLLNAAENIILTNDEKGGGGKGVVPSPATGGCVSPHAGRQYPARSCTYDIRVLADRNVRRYARSLDESTEDTDIAFDAPRDRIRAWSQGLVHRPAQRDHLPAGVYMLLYHDLNPHADRPWGDHAQISTTPEDFATHLQYCAERGRWVAPDEAADRLKRNAVDEPLFVLTFDDNFASVVTHGKQIIDRYGIKPLLFVNGASMAERHVHYRLLSAMLVARGHTDTLVNIVADNCAGHHSAPPAAEQVHAWLKKHYRAGWTDRIVREAYLRHHDHLPYELYLDEKQIRSLHADGWVIGNHTWSHARLSSLNRIQLDCELQRNEDWLTELIGQTPHWVSYPYGFPGDVGAAAQSWVEQRPPYLGVMADGGVNFHFQRGRLRRIPLADADLDEFRRLLHESILASQYEQYQTVLAGV